MVGAGRRRRVAGAAVRRRARAPRSPTCAPRPAARPRSSRWPARASPRSTVRRTRLVRLRREFHAARLDRRDRRRRRAGMATSRAVRRRAARRALLVDRHHPPPSRRAVAQGRGRHSELASRCSSGCSTAPSTLTQAGRHAGLLRLLARAGGRRASRSRRCWRASRASRASRSRPAELFGRAEFVTPDGDLRTLPLHLPDPEPRWGGLDGFFAARLMRI